VTEGLRSSTGFSGWGPKSSDTGIIGYSYTYTALAARMKIPNEENSLDKRQ